MSEPERPKQRRKDDRKASGDENEARARAHLEAAGLTLVAKNWKAPPRPGFGGHGGELDLVMRDGEVLVIV
ncbi:MAG TPA: YraN family protein, partial [Myxococcota bacterium]|nr:YraN family protein [Myxococcota bacterium]